SRQTAAECRHIGSIGRRRAGIEESDQRHHRCCARTANGHAAAPPTSEMKLRRLMRPQIEGPTLSHRQAAETALCITAKFDGRGPVRVKSPRKPPTRAATLLPDRSGSGHSFKAFCPTGERAKSTATCFNPSTHGQMDKQKAPHEAGPKLSIAEGTKRSSQLIGHP